MTCDNGTIYAILAENNLKRSHHPWRFSNWEKLPSTAGLIGVMPLAGALVLMWMYLENKGDSEIMQDFTPKALWGLLPSILFFLGALICFKKNLSLTIVLVASFGVWLGAAFIHQWILKGEPDKK